jgi:hypothetical protein
MKRHLLLLLLCPLVMAGCATPTGSPGPAASSSSDTATSSVGSAAASAPPSSGDANGDEVDYRVTYDFAVPSNPVTIAHTITPPIAQPPAPPLPYLVGIYVGNHPPSYQRISFYFRGAFPPYRFQYVREVTSDGSGAPVSLSGNSFLSIVFLSAQAHLESGASSVVDKPPAMIGFPNLRSYAPAGDFEGHVSFGLGIQTAPNSDQVLRIRAGELRKTDGSGGYLYVVHFDVESA